MKASSTLTGGAGAMCINRIELGSKKELIAALLKSNEVYVLSEQEMNARYRERVCPFFDFL